MKHPYRAPRIGFFTWSLILLICVLWYVNTLTRFGTGMIVLSTLIAAGIFLVYGLSSWQVKPASSELVSQLKGKRIARKYKVLNALGGLGVVVLAIFAAYKSAGLFYYLQSLVWGANSTVFLVSPYNYLCIPIVIATLPFLIIGSFRLVAMRFGTEEYRNILIVQQMRREDEDHADYISEARHFLRFGVVGVIVCLPMLYLGFSSYTEVISSKVVQHNLLTQRTVNLDSTAALAVSIGESRRQCGRVSCESFFVVDADINQQYMSGIDLGSRQWPWGIDYYSYYQFKNVRHLLISQGVPITLNTVAPDVLSNSKYAQVVHDYAGENEGDSFNPLDLCGPKRNHESPCHK